MKIKIMMIGMMLAGTSNVLAQGIGSPIYYCAPGKYQMSFNQIQAKKDRLVILSYKNGIKVVGFGKLKNSSSSKYSEKITVEGDQHVFVSANGDKIEIMLDSDFGSKMATSYLAGKRSSLQCINPSVLR